MYRIKKWIVRKLGGMMIEDLSEEVRIMILKENIDKLERLSRMYMDRDAFELFSNAFKIDI